jgi:hypothetical protein
MSQLTNNDLTMNDEKGVCFAYVEHMSLHGRRGYV